MESSLTNGSIRQNPSEVRCHFFLLFLLIFAGITIARGGEKIIFDAHPNWSGTNYFESGMRFGMVNYSSGDAAGISPIPPWFSYPANPTPYLFFFQNYGSHVVFSQTNGHAFGLVSVELADPQTYNSNSLPIIFKGFKTNGSIVTNIFTMPGYGSVALEQYPFSSEFAFGLTNVEILTRFAMDNLVIVDGVKPAPNPIPSQPRFGAPINLPLGGNPITLAAADFNRDGKNDIAVSVLNGAGFFFGIGNGTFSEFTNYVGFGSPYEAMAIGDCDNDGSPDVVAVASQGGSVLLNDGTGRFSQTNFDSTYSHWATGVAVADFDNEGHLDMAVVNRINMSAAFGKGDGSFGPPTNYSGGYIPADIVSGDLNGDGSPDLVIVGQGRVCVFMNRGDGIFAIQFFTASYYAHSPVLGDFNNDGNLDMAAFTSFPGSATVRLNNGRWFWSAKDYSLGLNPTSVASADVNGDGNVDILARGSSTVAVLLGIGDGSFVPGPQMSVPYNASGSQTMAVCDVDGDGLADLVFAGDNSVTVMLNQTPPTLQFTPLAGYHQISWPQALSTGFTLEYTTNLPAPDIWRPFPYPPVLIDGQKAVTDWADGAQKFYRLKKSLP